MKILFFNRWVGRHVGGTETHIKELALRLAKRGHEVHILTTEGDELRRYRSNVRCWYVGSNWKETPFSRSLKNDPALILYALMFAVKSFIIFLYLKIHRIEFDIISVHCFLEAFLVRCLKWILQAPCVFVFEGWSDPEAVIAKNANLKISISQAIAGRCHTRYHYKPLVIPIGVDRERFSPVGAKMRVEGAEHKIKILNVNRLSPGKNLDTLINAAKIALEKNQNLQFIIVGQGSAKSSLEKLVECYGLKGRVLFLGKVSDENLPSWYRSADIFVSPEVTKDEYLITVEEAMSAGLPVIVTSPSGSFELVGDCGVVVPPRSSELLAEKILELASNRELREKLSRRGLARIKDYDWNSLIKKYEEAYLSVAENCP
ncbi:MAG: glycosyltransferase family 4 protein [Candidatus Geothermarchaeales archaeon]